MSGAPLAHPTRNDLIASVANLHMVADCQGRDTSVEAILAHHGEERLSPEEFDPHFGSLPIDVEG